MDFSKIIWPITILASALILATWYYLVEINKSESFERQQRQENKIQEDKNRIEEQKLQLDKDEREKEYISKRTKDCLDIYSNESKKYNNVNSWSYNRVTDKCDLEYINQKWKAWTPEIWTWNEKLEIFENPKFFTNSF